MDFITLQTKDDITELVHSATLVQTLVLSVFFEPLLFLLSTFFKYEQTSRNKVFPKLSCTHFVLVTYAVKEMQALN